MIEQPDVMALWAVLPEARIVGGAVRDSLVGRTVTDVDFAVPLAPETIMARLRTAGIKFVPTGLAHGTVMAVVGGNSFEITTLRQDVATDGRHASVEFTDDWRVDASRRDFTINAMSAAQDGTIFDYFGGREDLAAGVVRFVGDAVRRVEEDHLRILRFFRFFGRYGAGAPDPAAVAAITLLRDRVQQLSAERVWAEIKSIMRAEDPRVTIGLMADTGVLELVMPGANVADLHALVARGAPADPLLRIAALMGENVTEFAARLRLSGVERERLGLMLVPNRLKPDADDADLRRALADDDLMVLVARSWLAQDDADGWDELRHRLAMAKRPIFPLFGRDLTARGVPPGPAVGTILAQVRRWWLAGGCVADRPACLDKIAECAALFRPAS
jgi:poly(A) polymerase/tRNA nucleotidyltransferase (CCA-adding enzyme)